MLPVGRGGFRVQGLGVQGLGYGGGGLGFFAEPLLVGPKSILTALGSRTPRKVVDRYIGGRSTEQ